MSLILEVKAGPLAGKRFTVADGHSVTVGRAADRANFAVPHDSFMSSLHFVVECGPGGGKVTDRKSSNGTFLNGARITESPLTDGDEIRSGQTIFVARLVSEAAATEPAAAPPSRRSTPPAPKPPKPAPAPAPMEASEVSSTPALRPAPSAQPRKVPAPESTLSSPASIPSSAPAAAPPPPKPARTAAPARPQRPALAVGGWTFGAIPAGWEAQGEFGIQRVEKNAFPSSVVVTEEPLGGAALDRFVEAQVAMLRQYLREPRIEAALPPAISGADEAVAVDIRYSTSDGQVVFLRRVFARRGQRAGVLTLTTLEKDWAEIRPAFDAALAGVSFAPGN